MIKEASSLPFFFEFDFAHIFWFHVTYTIGWPGVELEGSEGT